MQSFWGVDHGDDVTKAFAPVRVAPKVKKPLTAAMKRQRQLDFEAEEISVDASLPSMFKPINRRRS